MTYVESTDPASDVPVEVNGEIADVTIQSFDAVNAGQYITPLQDFTFAWNGVVVNFTQGIPALVDPLLRAALTASNQPFM